MNLYKDLPLWADENAAIINTIIEIPMGSMVKYEYNKDLNVVELDRFLTAPMAMPYNYGLLPQTYNAEDKDPLDVIVLSHYSLAPGSIAKAKVVGVLHMVDGGEADDKIIAIAYKDPFLWGIDTIDDVHKHTKDQIDHFLKHYKALEGKHVDVSGFASKEKAIFITNECYKNFKNKYSG
ncbi:MAG TPA: inorganic diphosphatase [Candidatus Absconditabacterales bacterium]|nr:inorganic diphosphatase [Candidatus Absconditabacterales bacterium]HMT27344.1 inorganic diphosphatase [Candidatus Absconditabacterales bacterium]